MHISGHMQGTMRYLHASCAQALARQQASHTALTIDLLVSKKSCVLSNVSAQLVHLHSSPDETVPEALATVVP